MARKIVLTALLIAIATPAFAMTPIPVDVKITDGTLVNGTYNDRTDTVFQQSETPYALVTTTDPGINVFGSWWTDPSNVINYSSAGPLGETQALLTLDWSVHPKTPGNWTVEGFVVQPDNDYGSKKVNFSFAPEPMSASLFLLGGLGLAIARRKRA